MTTKSPDLVVVSKPPTGAGSLGEDDSSYLERRRLARLNLTSEQFRLQAPGSDSKIFSVTDISQDGMALRLLDAEDLLLFPLAGKVAGTLSIHREKYEVTAQVKRVSWSAIGGQFVSLSQEAAAALGKFLDPAALGRELRPIPASESTVTWYHGPSGTDLLLKRGADGQFSRMTLFVLGSYIQWDKDTGASTGRTEQSQEPGEVRGILRFETLLLHPDPKLDPGKLRIAKTLVMSSNLPEDLRNWCVRQLR
jgi:hypothetical protein